MTEEDDFARILMLENVPDDAADRDSSAGRWFAAATLVLASLGVALLVTAGVIAGIPPGTPAITATPADASPEAAEPPLVAERRDETDVATAASAPARLAELPDPTWVRRVAAAGRMPERALAAYAGAALWINRTHPACGLGWNTLAAIGHVESEHGQMHGAQILPDGRVSPPIIGVQLDGNDVIAIDDTDEGRLDGDTTWDHAVGPMQFIPSTWTTFATDGNGDGAADINNIDDAALSAALYLCEAGGDLSIAENWIAAIAAYNPSIDYNTKVAESANVFATLGTP
jgi:membrane-bound lytic murein transglycosylase B